MSGKGGSRKRQEAGRPHLTIAADVAMGHMMCWAIARKMGSRERHEAFTEWKTFAGRKK